MRKNIINMLSFNVAWFFCIYYGNLAAIVSLIIFFLIHEKFVGHLKKEWPAILLITGVGLVGDNAIYLTGLIDFTGHTSVPLWLAITWFMFATTVIHGLAWMQKHHWIWQSALGAVAAPLAYSGGIKLGAASLPHSALLFYSLLAFCWAVALPVYFWIARIDYTRVNVGRLISR